MKKQILTLLLSAPLMLFARESYWKIEEVKPVIQRGLFFEAALDRFSNLDHILYDEDKKALWFYDSYTSEMPKHAIGTSLLEAEGKPSKEGRIEARIVGSELKILVYQDSHNIAFIICKKAADDKAAFLESVQANRKQLLEYKMDAVKAHPPVTLPAGNITSGVKVGLDGFSVTLPADKYLVMKTASGSYEVLDKNSKDLTAAFTIYKESFNRNDSLQAEDLYPLLKEGALQVNTTPYYDWREKKKGTSGYALSNSVQAGNTYINIVSGDHAQLEALSPYIGSFRSLTTDMAGSISMDVYNANGATNEPQRTVKAGGVQLKLPAAYQVRDFLAWGNNYYAFELTTELSFSSDKPNSGFYHITDTTNNNASSMDVARGGLYSLKNSSLKTSIQDIRESFLKEGSKILAEDSNGIMYYYRQSCWVCRYVQRGDTHYVYVMEFPNLSACAKEFGRSANMFQ